MKRPARYQIGTWGPKFSSRTEALAYANHELKQGRSVTINVLNRKD